MSIEYLQSQYYRCRDANQDPSFSRQERIRYYKIGERIRLQLNPLVMAPHKTHKQVITQADGEYEEGTRSYRRTVIPE